ncbi:MAG: hypothetical protein AAFR17_11145 [Pseudomonadota bacterium]
MAFFDFTRSLPRYLGKERTVDRLDRRREVLITPFRDEIAGARVLDLASHDGRWPLRAPVRARSSASRAGPI